MNNQVYLGDDGFIHLDYKGEQNYQTAKADQEPMDKLVRMLHQQGKKAYILVDATNVPKQDSGARKAAVEIVLSVPYDRVALYGGSPFIRNVAGLIVKAVGKSHKFGFFATREEAVKWLKS